MLVILFRDFFVVEVVGIFVEVDIVEVGIVEIDIVEVGIFAAVVGIFVGVVMVVGWYQLLL